MKMYLVENLWMVTNQGQWCDANDDGKDEKCIFCIF